MEISEEDATRAYVEMSGRKGFGVKADDMLDELERKATAAVHANANAEFSAEEAGLIGRQVAIAARSPRSICDVVCSASGSH